jgi:3-dehydroquinate synthase
MTAPEAADIETVRVAVPYAYPVCFTQHAFAPANRTLVDALRKVEPDRCHRVVVVADQGVVGAWPRLFETMEAYAHAHQQHLQLTGEPFVVPGGEACKNDPLLPGQLHELFARLGLDRQSFCLVVGGGAVLDMAGFAASTAHRGLRVVRMPTTVLSQNDGGVGVKNGVNLFGVKNFLGTFAPPFAVINDFSFLETLDRRDRIAGLAEAVKVALLRDAHFFEWLCEHERELCTLQPAATHTMVKRCAKLHLEHIQTSGDPFEFGSARPLDLGHWSAHKLESLTDHELRHGEAVAIGLALDCLYAEDLGLLASEPTRRILDLLEHLGFCLYHPALEQKDDSGELEVLRGLQEFREHLGGELTVTLLEGIARPLDAHEMDATRIRSAIATLAERQRARSERAAP